MNKHHTLNETSLKRNTNKLRAHFLVLHCVCVCVCALHTYMVVHACLKQRLEEYANGICQSLSA